MFSKYRTLLGKGRCGSFIVKPVCGMPASTYTTRAAPASFCFPTNSGHSQSHFHSTQSHQLKLTGNTTFNTASTRPVHTTGWKRKDDGDSWWFRKLTKAEKLDTPSTTQSSLLSDLDSVYELQFHRVKPSYMQDYLNEWARFAEMMSEKSTGAELLGSWTCMIGDQDESHLWVYKGGYPQFNKATMIYRTDPEILRYRMVRNQMLRSRFNQILLRFAFWPFNKDREPGNMYEMRSYELRPGSTIEWGNHWARGLKYRQDNNAAVCGFFSHIGQLYMCHHLWAYADLQTRKETREAAWSRPGWDENVRYTVPLIKSLQTRILIPTPFSPLQ